MKLPLLVPYTLPETNIFASKTGGFPIGISFFQGSTFRGELLVSGSVLLQCINRMKPTKPTMFSHEKPRTSGKLQSSPQIGSFLWPLIPRCFSFFWGGTKLSSLLLKPVARPAFFLRWNSLRKKGWECLPSSVSVFLRSQNFTTSKGMSGIEGRSYTMQEGARDPSYEVGK